MADSQLEASELRASQGDGIGGFGYKPHADALALAGYMTPESVGKYLPNLSAFPNSTQEAIRARLNRYSELEPQSPYKPANFFRIDEREVLTLIQEISGNIPPSLENLTGFEWVEIENLIAGHMVTGPLMPGWEALPADLDQVGLAKFSLYSGMNAPLPIKMVGLNLLCDWEIGASLQRVNTDGPQILLGLNIQLVLSPIHVMLLEGRTIAISNIQRLTSLAQCGISRALCLVSYGYGLSSLGRLPTTDTELLFSKRPPLVTDFIASNLGVIIPVRQPSTVIQVRLDTVTLGASG